MADAVEGNIQEKEYRAKDSAPYILRRFGATTSATFEWKIAGWDGRRRSSLRKWPAQDKPCSNFGNVGGQTSARSYST